MSNRRHFLLGGAALLGLFNSPIRKLLSSLIGTRAEHSFSRVAQQDCRNYIQLNYYGGPSRWYFDSFLKPNKTDLFYQNPMVKNYIKSTDLKGPNPYDLDYRFYEINGINFPHLWSNKIPTADGKTNPMSVLASNMLNIRGVNLEGTIGHPFNSAKMTAPKIGGLSIDGLISDIAQTPLPAISLGSTPANRAFKSKAGSIIRINSKEENYLDFLLNPFYLEGSKILKDDPQNEALIEEALSALENNQGKLEGNHSLYSDLKKSRKYFQNTIDSFLSEYDSLVKKYSSLIKRSMESELDGVSVQKLPGLRLPLEVSGKKELDELIGMFFINDHYLLDSDLRRLLKKASLGKMAEEFAIAEYVITKGLSTSVVIATENEMGHMFKKGLSSSALAKSQVKLTYNQETNTTKITNSRPPQKMEINFPLDSHGTGLMPDFISSHYFYYSLSSCLNELIESLKKVPLKKGNLFDETLIHLTAEFDRRPNEFLNGSGHNEQAHVSSLFSGAIEKHQVLGDIFSEVAQNPVDEFESWGTIGNGAPVASFDNNPLGISNLSSSISSILRLEPIVARAPSFLRLENGVVRSTIADGKNVEGSYCDYCKKS